MTFAERIKSYANAATLRKRGTDWRKQLKGYWRASSMGMCGRQQAYDFLGFRIMDERDGSDRAWSLEDGHLHEGDIIDRFKDMKDITLVSSNEVVKRTFKTKNGITVNIAGTPDAIIKDKGVLLVVEIKALQDYAFQEVKRKNEAPEKYVTQLKTYLLLHKIERGVLLIKNRNNSDVLSFEYTLSAEDKAKLLKRQVLLQRYVDSEKMPPRDYQLGSQECFYCPHNKRCHEGKTFKGYIHKKDDAKEVQVDLSEEPKAQKTFMVAAKTYEQAKRKMDELSTVQSDAKETLEKLMKHYKADALSAQGYTARSVVSSGHDMPDPIVLKRMVEEGKIPTVKSRGSQYIRVDLPRGTK